MNIHYAIRCLILSSILLTGCSENGAKEEKAYVPVIASGWWRICEMPDLGELDGSDQSRQHIVDHGFIQSGNGKWQLWACIRGTAVGRLLYRWEGDNLNEGQFYISDLADFKGIKLARLQWVVEK
jgi:hypothetical protein